MESRTEEDRLIEILEIEGGNQMYEDNDFIPSRQSLYEIEEMVPPYDEDVVSQIVWRRPHEFIEGAEYFTESYASPSAVQGTLNDEVFLGTLLGVCAYLGQDLMQNIIASRPDDFKTYGIFTCRFYVEGEWVEVITDTRIPCIQNQNSGACLPIYAHSPIAQEMWICLIEKAYAKAVGSYEALQKVKVNESLLHLTGGSVQQFNIHDDNAADSGPDSLWRTLKSSLSQDTLILTFPKTAEATEDMNEIEGKSNVGDENESKTVATADYDSTAQIEGVMQDRLYSVLMCKEFMHGQIQLILICNPWGNADWQVEWHENSHKWDDFPDVLRTVTEDPKVVWRRGNPQGFLWMTLKEFTMTFNTVYMCKVFASDKYKYYSVKGEWRDLTAGGPMHTVRDKESVVKDAIESFAEAPRKATAAIILDSDSSWFNNPQYRISVTKPTKIFLSVTPFGSESENAPIVAVDIVTTSSELRQSARLGYMWDVAMTELVASEKVYGTGRVKGQEASIWDVLLLPSKAYYIIPHTMRRGISANFILRVHSLEESVTIEHLSGAFHTQVISGEWRRSSDIDSTGGPLYLPPGSKKENSKWCQNPQILLKMSDQISREEIHMKIVVRRTDKPVSSKSAVGVTADKAEAHVGLVACMADYLEDKTPDSKKGNKAHGPKKNAFGEIIVPKASSLKNRSSSSTFMGTREERPKTVLRKISVASDTFVAMTSFCARNDCSLYISKLPRAWLDHGMILIPCLSEKNVRGSFEVEISTSEVISTRMLQDTDARSLAGEWIEGSAGGSHLCPTWKKNQKYHLKIRTQNDLPAKVNITLTRQGDKLRNIHGKETISSMIGFYVFISKNGDLAGFYESPFVPTDEVSTDEDFTLDALSDDEVYVIMPTTYAENKFGSYVLTVLSHECELSLTKEGQHHHHK